MTGPSGLRRFVPGAAPPPGRPPGGAAAPAGDPAAAAGTPPGGPVPPAAPFPEGAAEILAARAREGSGPGPEEETCEMCKAAIPADHGHVADLEASSLLCTCRACYLLFTQSRTGRYRSVPDRYLSDPAHPLSAREWDELEIPVGLAFFLRSSARGQVAGFYPSPAGATESRLDLAAWDRLTADHPLLGAAEPDVEAALICRADDGAIEHFLVPVDACYELAGRMRLSWRGFDGGAEARDSIAAFLDTVRSRAAPLRGDS